MALTKDEAFGLIRETIEFEITHDHYKPAGEISKWAHLVMGRTASDQEGEILRYRIRETDDQKKQRLRLTNPMTSVVVEPAYAYFSEIKRTDGVKMTVEHENENILNRIQEHFTQYSGHDSLLDYVFGALLHYNKYDPNAWIVYEQRRGATDEGGERIESLYPLEVTNEEALRYEFDKDGNLIYLLILFISEEIDTSAGNLRKVKVKDYYLYGRGFTWHFAEVRDDLPGRPDFMEMGYAVEDTTKGSFWVKSFDNFTLEVPAIRCGAYLSGEHGRKIAETPIHGAKPLLSDLIRDKSYLDTTKTLHVFPRLFEYVKPCNHVDEKSGECCENGWIGGVKDPDQLCPSCSGAGFIVHKGEQDVIRLLWPRTPEEVWDLTKLSHYEELPFPIVQFMKDEVDWLRKMVQLAIFNQESIDKTMTVQTATEIRIEYDRIYNKLAPFAEKVARAWELAYRIAFQYHGASDPTVDMTFPLDFKLKSVNELTREFAEAKGAGLPYDSIWSIACDILQKQYRNAPDVVREIKAFEKWRPFKGKAPEEVFGILQGRANDDPDKILWENWDRVVNEIQIDLAETSFADILDENEQRRIVYDKAAQVAGEIRYKSSGSLFGEPLQIAGNGMEES